MKKDSIKEKAIVACACVGLLILIIVIFNRVLVRNQAQLLTPPMYSLQSIGGHSELQENEAENPTLDTTGWNTYKTAWYGFEVKYPTSWSKPVLKSAPSGSRWEYRYQFRHGENRRNAGFDVVVYNVARVQELSGTDEFPAVKDDGSKTNGSCTNTVATLAENEEYPAEQVYVSPDDACYETAYFYTLTRDNYIYNITPAFVEHEDALILREREIIEEFPEFVAVASTFNLIDIVRPKPQPKITAPHPASATKRDSQGRMVCAKKDDNPSKSKSGKKKHLDMECCLDPDEYPNPWCYYPPEKYGKLLEKL